MGPIKLIIADDHFLAREGIKAVLATASEVEIIGEASNGEEAVAVVRDLRPDVVLMDVRMPGMDGVEATRRIKETQPDVAVVMLTMYDDDVYVIQAVQAGAAGYLLKDVSRDLLLHTIKAAQSGITLIKSSVLRTALSLKSRSGGQVTSMGRESFGLPHMQASNTGGETLNSRQAGLLKGLSPRELEVLDLLAMGKTNKEIGHGLHITELTVKKHVANVITKLGAANRSDAAVRGVMGGMVHREPARSN